ncbi:ABC transporter permease [Candidatus Pelagibacter sp. Uisw_134_02]|jgi:ABC-2 type transport system permease protein|uniref:ABC transporter permease n=1 Tax=Candidatus Pelagibacter sp. Uisw_134_02 TaxID=3230990 RepID=UPI0039EA9008
MVELNKKYQINVKRFGFINWIGFKSLWFKECNRFIAVWQQTLLSPLVSSLLFLSVLSLALGNNRGDVLGFSFMSFLAPGLIAMSILTQSFSHSVSSLMIGKIQGNIVDMLYAPLSALEVTMAIILAALTRSFLIAIISIGVFSIFVDIPLNNILFIFIFGFLSAFILGSLGFIAGLWAEKFDHTATVTNFVITPLSFLSGVFYSIDKLPNFFQIISNINPFFYMIDGFRYGFLGKSDGSISVGLIYLSALSIVTWCLAFLLYKKGYKIKS